MARIIYSVAGEGFGHSTRSLEVINFLIKQGHAVKIVSYGKGYENLSETFPVIKIFGLCFVYRNNEVKYLETAYQNLLQAPEAVKSFKILDKLIDKFKPQIIISDFEPLAAAAANLKKIPLISLDNEHILTKTKHDYPCGYGNEQRVAKFITRMMMFRAKAYLVLSFFDCAPLSRKISVFPPIIRQAVLNLRPSVGDYTIVYLNNKFEGLLDILKKQNEKFVVYGFNCQKTDKNLIFKKNSQAGFLRDLAGAKAVVATAGFSLISEALYLGKPYLAVPAQQQFEQRLNAYHLAKLGFGECHEELNAKNLADFFKKINFYKKNLKGGIKSGNAEVGAKLEALIKIYTK